MTQNIHMSQPLHSLGPAPELQGLAAILIHGRTQSPADMFAIAARLDLPSLPYIALQAAGKSWYPDKFMAPVEANQPNLDFALARIEELVLTLERSGVPRSRIVLIGFSQGACLACEYIYRNPERWGGVVAYTGGLIGPEGMSWLTSKTLDGTPILLGNSDVDQWVPLQRTNETAEVFRSMGALVQLKIYPGMEHVVNDDEIALGRELLKQLLSTS